MKNEHLTLEREDILFRIVVLRRWVVVFYRHPRTFDLGYFWGRGEPFHPLLDPHA